MTTLPIHEILADLRAQLSSHEAVILSAPPGSSKTTVDCAPDSARRALAGGSDYPDAGPRRIATRLAAVSMASQLGETAGQTVGYRVRFESKVSAATPVEVVTEGI